MAGHAKCDPPPPSQHRRCDQWLDRASAQTLAFVARRLLAESVLRPLDERVQERIVAETRGNPLALLELPHGLSMTELAGGFGLLEASPDAMVLSGRIEDSYLRRISDLPAPTRQGCWRKEPN